MGHVRAGFVPTPGGRVMDRYVTVGLGVLAVAALIEAALIPGIVVAGAAVLAPRLVRQVGRGLFQSRPGAPKSTATAARRPSTTTRPNMAAVGASETAADALAVPNGSAVRRWSPIPAGLFEALQVREAVAKTITFRIVATLTDFTTNYLVLGDPAIAAGLSGIGLIAGPVFYLVHETVWNYYLESSRMTVDVPALLKPGPGGAAAEGGFRVSRALAKTITFRGFGTVIDFTTNLIVVGDLATATGLSAVGFVVGPFVYIGHEKVWERIRARWGRDSAEQPQADLATVPAAG
jgi:uncharacterized membrane protein